ncbi:putative CtpA-like serine protease [bacterium BMS3Abin05]|nr:putative CtpA-like serine protease [bacterium BMS3Abin05]GBE28428.1 putative CtpA-like serine protease [bacterium BMS3Bbin03]HDZ11929.1 S41 family peptidase [Bacteroidota bacterium]
MKWKKQGIWIVVLTILTISLGGWMANMGSPASPDYYLEVQKNLTLFVQVYKEVTLKYVEEIDPNKFMRVGVNRLLDALDPYTMLLERDQNEEMSIMTRGKYGGVGMTISIRDEWPTVVEPPFSGTPALKAGIREGDQIIEVDGKSTKGEKISKTAIRLRGRPGTSVIIKVRRAGVQEPLEFHLIRAVISVHDVSYTGIIRDGVGYIKLRRFSKNVGKEISDAIKNLKSKGMTTVILDLRSNPGGLLPAAVNVANVFLPKGTLIVSTRGRTPNSNQKFRAEKEPVAPDLPLAILVDGNSASASEIVTGAIQDMDRGVVVGTRTFGKGLVQTIVPLSKTQSVKITTAKYYIPSGRCINNDKHTFRNSVDVFVHPDSFKSDSTGKKAYHTKDGRVVYGGGGIEPDIVVKNPKLSNFEWELIRKSMFFNFAVRYASTIRDTLKPIIIQNNVLKDFREYLKGKKFTFNIEGIKALDSLEKTAKDRKYGQPFEENLKALKTLLGRQKYSEFNKSEDFMKRMLRLETIAKLKGSRAEIRASLEGDKTVGAAISILTNPQKYRMKLGLSK